MQSKAFECKILMRRFPGLYNFVAKQSETSSRTDLPAEVLATPCRCGSNLPSEGGRTL